jgi:hypothetical protein
VKGFSSARSNAQVAQYVAETNPFFARDSFSVERRYEASVWPCSAWCQRCNCKTGRGCSSFSQPDPRSPHELAHNPIEPTAVQKDAQSYLTGSFAGISRRNGNPQV